MFVYTYYIQGITVNCPIPSALLIYNIQLFSIQSPMYSIHYISYISSLYLKIPTLLPPFPTTYPVFLISMSTMIMMANQPSIAGCENFHLQELPLVVGIPTPLNNNMS